MQQIEWAGRPGRAGPHKLQSRPGPQAGRAGRAGPGQKLAFSGRFYFKSRPDPLLRTFLRLCEISLSQRGIVFGVVVGSIRIRGWNLLKPRLSRP